MGGAASQAPDGVDETAAVRGGGGIPRGDRNADAALRLARKMFMAEGRIDSQRLAAALEVDRTTLFRWVGNRDQLLVSVLTSLADPTLRDAAASATGTGPERIALVMRTFSQALIDAPYYRAFLEREPERALRLITTKASPLQQHVVAAVQRLLEREQDRGHLSSSMDLTDLAYIVVRIAESFIYADLITGEEPDPGKVQLAVAAVLYGSPQTQSDAGRPNLTGRSTDDSRRRHHGQPAG
jgi:AcrR family transcriptional regulator